MSEKESYDWTALCPTWDGALPLADDLRGHDSDAPSDAHEAEAFDGFGNLFDSLDTGAFHLAPRDPRNRVVVDSRGFRHSQPGAVALVGVECLEHVVEFHDSYYAYLPSISQADRHKAIRDDSGMRKEHMRPIQENIRRLLSLAQESVPTLTLNGWAVALGLDQSTIYRISEGTRDPSTDVVQAIADKLGVAAWQLLAPDMGGNLFTYDEKTRSYSPVFAVGKLRSHPPDGSLQEVDQRDKVGKFTRSVGALPEGRQKGMRQQSRSWKSTKDQPAKPRPVPPSLSVVKKPKGKR